MTAPTVARIDAHQHFWSLARGDYGWLTPALEPLYRDFSPSDLQPMREAHRITATVLVQAAPTVAETRYLLGLATVHGFIRGVVGWVDLTAAEAPLLIDEFAEHPAFKGVRPMLQDLADPAWIETAPIDAAIAHLQRRGLSFDALVKPPHLPHLLRFAERHDALPIVIDHAAKPVLKREGRDAGFDQWRGGMAALARLPHLHCKLSGLVTEADADWQVETLRRHVDTVLELFGPSRVMWGSDWPVLELASSCAGWVAATDQLLASLSPAERQQILAGTAERFYRLAPAP